MASELLLISSLLFSLMILTQSVGGCTDQNPCEKPPPPPKPHCHCECNCNKPKKHTPHVPKPPPKSPPPPVPKPPPKTPDCPPPPVLKPPPPPPPKAPECPPPPPPPPKAPECHPSAPCWDHPPHKRPSEPHCPVNTLKLRVCTELLGGLLGGLSPLNSECCPLIQGLVNFEAAVCLCQVVKTDILGIRIEYDYKFTMLVNHCRFDIPPGFQCA